MADQFAWLIEQNGPAFGPRWWNGDPNCPRGFTQDANEAIRFARREDAEKVISTLSQPHRCLLGTDEWVFGFPGLVATEHGWLESGGRLNEDAIKGRRNREALHRLTELVEGPSKEFMPGGMAADASGHAQAIIDLASARLRNPQDLTPNTKHDLNEILRLATEMLDRALPLRDKDGLNAVWYAARSVVTHWSEFGPEHGLDENMERLRKTLMNATVPLESPMAVMAQALRDKAAAEREGYERRSGASDEKIPEVTEDQIRKTLDESGQRMRQDRVYPHPIGGIPRF